MSVGTECTTPAAPAANCLKDSAALFAPTAEIVPKIATVPSRLAAAYEETFFESIIVSPG
jgi:hypothetical protein